MWDCLACWAEQYRDQGEYIYQEFSSLWLLFLGWMSPSIAVTIAFSVAQGQDSFCSLLLTFLFLLQQVCCWFNSSEGTNFLPQHFHDPSWLQKQGTQESSEGICINFSDVDSCPSGNQSSARHWFLLSCIGFGAAKWSAKDAKFKAKNRELKTTGVKCLASRCTGSLSCSGSPDLMCKINISVLSFFLY